MVHTSRSPRLRRTLLALQALESRLTPTAIPAPPGLVSWWPGDGDALDIVGTNHGTLQNGADFYQGHVADGINFDGFDGMLTAPTAGLPVGSASRTIELWVQIDQQVAGEAFFCSYSTPNVSTAVYTLGRLNDGRLFVSTWGPGFTGPVLQDDRWYHVAATNVGTSFSLYLDGTLTKSGNVPASTPAGSSFLIGRQGPGSIGDYRRLDGMVDEVSVYNRALTGSEIQSIYDAGRDGKIKPYMVVNNSTPGEGDVVSVPPSDFVIDFSHPPAALSLQAADLTVNGISASSFEMLDDNSAKFHFATSPVTVAGPQSMNMAAGCVEAAGSVASPSLRAWARAFTYEYVPPVQVASAIINDGATQRSRVTSLTINFDSVVTLPTNPADAFQVRRQSDNTLVDLSAFVTNDTATHVTLSFNGLLTEFGSLADGRYSLAVLAAQVSNANGQLDGNGDGAAGDDYTLAVHRLFGDADGDADVDATDFGAFRGAFGGTASVFDFDNDGDVDTSDFGQFRMRFGMII